MYLDNNCLLFQTTKQVNYQALVSVRYSLRQYTKKIAVKTYYLFHATQDWKYYYCYYSDINVTMMLLPVTEMVLGSKSDLQNTVSNTDYLSQECWNWAGQTYALENWAGKHYFSLVCQRYSMRCGLGLGFNTKTFPLHESAI